MCILPGRTTKFSAPAKVVLMSQGPLKIIVYNHKCMVVFPTILENSGKSCQQLLSKLRKGSVGQKYSASAWNEALVVVCIVHHSSRGEGIDLLRLWLHCESGFCVGPGAGAGPRNFLVLDWQTCWLRVG